MDGIQIIPKELSMEEMFRLVEIAHTTPHSEVRLAAVHLLKMALHPLVLVPANPDLHGNDLPA
jgi:hypothetical protein